MKGLKFVLREEQLAEIKQAFQVLDKSGSGLISGNDLRVALRALGFEPTKHEISKVLHDISKKNITNASRRPDSLNFEEFIEFMKEKLNEPDSREHLKASFHLFKGSSSMIGLSDLRRVACEIGESISDEELLEMIREADRDKDGFVNEDDFIVMASKN